MSTHAAKARQNDGHTTAASLPTQQHGPETAIEPEDKRLEAVAQKRAQEVANNSPRAQQLGAVQYMANNSPKVKQLKAYQAIADKNAPRSIQQSEGGVIQRFLDGNDRLPDEDRVLDDLLDSFGYDDLNLFSAADYAQLGVLHTALLAREDGFDAQNLQGGPLMAERARMRGDFAAVENFAQASYLVEDSDAWNTAVGHGADDVEQNAVTANAAAVAAWPGRANHPQEFEDAITAEVAARQAAAAAAIAAAYDAYNNDGRLLIGTINQIKLAIPGAVLAAVNARLLLVYHRQCEPTRVNWLSHLGIAGNAMDGNAGLHFTTYNNSVPNPVNIRVDLRSRNQIMDDLFGAVPTGQQLHATKVHAGISYHKYYDGTFIPAGGPPDVTALGHLNAEYNRMIAVMRARVQAAKDEHGRIHHNNHGQQLDVGP